jgi:negative regulator of genetic competence, sporulation and motility
LQLKSKEVKASTSKTVKEDQLSEDLLIVKYKTPLSSSTHSKLGTKLVTRVSSLSYDVVQVKDRKKLIDVIKSYSTLADVVSISRSANVTRYETPDLKASEMYHLNLLNIGKVHNLQEKTK